MLNHQPSYVLAIDISYTTQVPTWIFNVQVDHSRLSMRVLHNIQDHFHTIFSAFNNLNNALEMLKMRLKSLLSQFVPSFICSHNFSDVTTQRLNSMKALPCLLHHLGLWNAIFKLVGTFLAYIGYSGSRLGVDQLLQQVRLVIEGTYHPKSYSRLQFELTNYLQAGWWSSASCAS